MKSLSIYILPINIISCVIFFLDNHEVLFLYGGFKDSRKYRYWDPEKRGINFKWMIEDLENAPENAVIILQISAHNPTGCDLTREQWIKVADVMKVPPCF